MRTYVIENKVPTPEEMAEILGLAPERVTAVRRIMSTPKPVRKSASKKSAIRRTAALTVAKR